MIATRVWLLSATILSLAVPGAAVAQALQRDASDAEVIRLAALVRGSIYGVVVDEAGGPVDGVVVSALGGATAFAVTDHAGQYQLTELPPGPYVVRAHCDGFAAPRSTLVNVRSATRAPSSFTLHRADSTPTVMAAGLGAVDVAIPATPKDEGEVAWRLRRLKRSVLKDTGELPADLAMTDDDWFLQDSVGFIGRAVGSSARLASSLLADLPLYGQVNFLTATAYDDSGDMVDVGRSTGVAFFAVGAPVGDQADWTARATMNGGDLTSWTIASDYVTRPTEHQRYTVGMTYSLQRYEGGPFAAQAVPDGHRKVASISASHDLDLSSTLTVGYGSKYQRYDYLDGHGLLSPHLRVAWSPTPRVQLHAKASYRRVAPGAEEFIPPADAQWVPPGRTFAPLGSNRFSTESVQHYELGVRRQFSNMSVAVRAFRQHIDDQLVTVFGAPDPVRFIAAGGHYGLASAGDAAVQGWAIRLDHELSAYVKGTIDYTLASSRWEASSGADRAALQAHAPRALREPRERLHDLTTSLEASVPQSNTRLVVVYKLNSGFAGDPGGLQTADGRFDLQLRQGLPFMSVAKGDWEMLVGVRSLFRSSLDDRSLYDELLVVRPPKRVIGGVQVRF